jgi:2-polyprenyl-3-methyl-5-hydroxy-6-metoxy-1,4-benzoquinol methylase
MHAAVAGRRYCGRLGLNIGLNSRNFLYLGVCYEGECMKPEMYKLVFQALRKELEEQGYDSHKLEALMKNYSWFLSEFSLLRALLRSKLPIDEYRHSLNFLVKRHEVLAKEIKSRSTVLDIGCGLGFLTCLLAKKNCRAYGIDTEEDNLRVARRLSKMLDIERLCTFQKAESSTLSFNESKFDYVVLSWTLHDIKQEDREPLLSECIRVLKSSGKLLILDPESQLSFDQIQEMMSKQPVRRIQQKALSTVYDHGTFSNASLAIISKGTEKG